MKRVREKPSVDPAAQALAAYGEQFMSMFDDYDEQAAKQPRMAQLQEQLQPSTSTSSSDEAESQSDDEAGHDAGGSSADGQRVRQAAAAGAEASAATKLDAFLGSRRIGSAGGGGGTAGAPPSKAQLAAQQQERQQQRLLEQQLKKRFMSSKVGKIFDDVDAAELAKQQQAAEEDDGVSAADFDKMRRDVELLGASALDKRSAKAVKASMLAKLGASAEKRQRMPASFGLRTAANAKRREAAALQEAIAAGMVKAKGRGKKARAQKAKSRDKGLQEAGRGFRNGVLRMPKLRQ